jgi:hypothetical protein
MISAGAFCVRFAANFLTELSFPLPVGSLLSYVTVSNFRLLKTNTRTNEVSSVLILAIRNFTI